ncbi:DNA-dependent RNA polymerase subunit epsilon [Fredinandcohnia sp. 179-A 10B2 NHS]|uniref:DNA-dependent RNA polymerase subunit epsilon n=1 Tax=Fredinandcohnia sp. 179-A 10B2 NHS TaxID=3235176 RepID=UPI0039A16D5A
MIYKVYYQEHAHEVPVREKTKSVFVNGVSEADVRRKLKERNINIEYIQRVEGAFLEYEKQNEDYKVLEN